MTLMQWLCDTVDNNDKMFSEKNSTHGKNFRDGRDKSHVCFPLTLKNRFELSFFKACQFYGNQGFVEKDYTQGENAYTLVILWEIFYNIARIANADQGTL